MNFELNANVRSAMDEKLMEWEAIVLQATVLKDREMTLRKELFAMAFPKPTEGTNKLEIGNGYLLKGDYKLNRRLDEAALPTVLGKLKEINYPLIDRLVKYKPDMSIAEYRKLTDEQRKIMDECLTTSPGSPTLEIVAPKATA